MKLVVFAYSFSHGKSYLGLTRLHLGGYTPLCVIGVPAVPVTWGHSAIRTMPKGITYPEAGIVCRQYGWTYREVAPASDDALRYLDLLRPDIGLILGARILPAEVIDRFREGIINLHPGLLPCNRGLDNVKRAVLYDWPQVMTSHLISPRIDLGRTIMQRSIQIYRDDTLMDMELRLLGLGMGMIGPSIERVLAGGPFPPIPYALYNQVLTPEQEAQMLNKLPDYLKRFSQEPTD